MIILCGKDDDRAETQQLLVRLAVLCKIIEKVAIPLLSCRKSKHKSTRIDISAYFNMVKAVYYEGNV